MQADLSRFIAITPIINSPRYKVRAENYFKFKDVCDQAGITLITVECAFGDRPFEVTERDNLNHLQFRTKDELWLKECLIRRGMEYALQIYPDTREIGWFDSDQFPISITPRKWFEEIWHALQHYEFVQAWEYLINFGPDGQPISGPQMSFMKTYAANGFEVPKGKNVKHTLAGNSGMVSLGRPGLAWAASVNILNKVNLPDRCILGSGDWHFAHALVEAMEPKSPEFKLSKYSEYLLNLQEQCRRWVKRDVGYVPVTVGHWYHGDKKDRKYGDRGRILIENQYDPETDVKYDAQGLLVLETFDDRQIRLRDQIRAYFASRNEDSVPLR